MYYLQVHCIRSKPQEARFKGDSQHPSDADTVKNSQDDAANEVDGKSKRDKIKANEVAALGVLLLQSLPVLECLFDHSRDKRRQIVCTETFGEDQPPGLPPLLWEVKEIWSSGQGFEELIKPRRPFARIFCSCLGRLRC